jgi:hypothetical protein
MNSFPQVVRSAMLFGVVALALAGCGAGDSGPSSSTVKRLAANASYNDVLKMGNFRLQMEAIGGTSSPRYKKIHAEMEKFEKHKARFVHKLEDNMREKGCTKVGGGKYNCSVVVRNPKTHKKKSFIVTINKAGSVWTLSRIKPV